MEKTHQTAGIRQQFLNKTVRILLTFILIASIINFNTLFIDAQQAFADDAPATTASVALSIDKDTTTNFAYVGDTLTATYTIAADGFAYGAAFSFSFPAALQAIVQFDQAATLAANSGIPNFSASVSYNNVVVQISPDGSAQIITASAPLVVQLKFKVIAVAQTDDPISIGEIKTSNNLQLVRIITDSSLTASAVYGASNANTNAWIAAGQMFRLYTDTAAQQFKTGSSVIITSVPDKSVYNAGDTAVIDLTLSSSSEEIYGFTGTIDIINAAPQANMFFDLAATVSANSGVPGLSVVQADRYVQFSIESDGTTKRIAPGANLTLKLCLNVLSAAPSATTAHSYTFGGTKALNLAFFTDSTLRLADVLQATGVQIDAAKVTLLEAQAKVAWGQKNTTAFTTTSSNTATFEVGNKIEGGITTPYSSASAHSAAAEVQTGVWNDITGTEDPSIVIANYTITSTSDVYGATAYLVFPPAIGSTVPSYLSFDAVRFANLNAGWQVVESNKLIYESDGSTKLIAAGGSITLQFPFVIGQPVDNAQTWAVTSHNQIFELRNAFWNNSTGAAGNFQTYLLLDPTLRLASLAEPLGKPALNALVMAGQVTLPVASASNLSIKTVFDRPAPLVAGSHRITRPLDLDWLADQVNNKGFTDLSASLRQNVTPSASFAGIGTADNPYTGKFNSSSRYYIDLTGTGARTITDATNAPDTAAGGLFNYVGPGANINAVVVGAISVNITNGNVSVGGVVGLADGATLDGLTNYYATGNQLTISGSASGANSNIGGLVGTMSNNSTLAMSGFLGSITIAGGANVGGLVGSAINSSLDRGLNAAGAANTRSNGNIGNITGDGIVGGIVGVANNTTIDEAGNRGVITGATAGGIVGQTAGATVVSNSWHGSVRAGGALNTGSTATAVNGSVVAGGIVGHNTSTALQLTGNFAFLPVSGSGDVGAVVGKSNPVLNFPLNYFLNDAGLATAPSDAAGATEISLARLGVVSSTVYSQGSQNCRYSILSTFAGAGNGTPASPYELATVADLLWFRDTFNLTNSVWAVLTNDLDMSAEAFSGIAGSYAGTFDGAGHSITLDMSGSGYGGLFVRTNGATIKNLTIKGSVMSASQQAGGVVGDAISTTFVNVTNEATVTANVAVSYSYAGGIAGWGNTNSFTDCVNKGDITAGTTAGGIGNSSMFNNTYVRCENYGAITSLGRAVGGIAGEGGPAFTDCVNFGTVTGGGAAGGIVGILWPINSAGRRDAATEVDVQVTGCTNNGNISGTGSVGGIIGIIDPSSTYNRHSVITDNINNGDVTGTTSSSSAGGILGGDVAWLATTQGGVVIAWTQVNLLDNANHGTITGGRAGAIAGSTLNNPGGHPGGIVFEGNFSSVPVPGDSNPSSATVYDPATHYVKDGVLYEYPVERDPNDTTDDTTDDTNDDTTLGIGSMESSGTESTTSTDSAARTESTDSTDSPASADPTANTTTSNNPPIPQSTAAPDATSTSLEKDQTVFEIVSEVIAENPVLTAAVLIVIVGLTFAGALWRYRRSRETG